MKEEDEPAKGSEGAGEGREVSCGHGGGDGGHRGPYKGVSLAMCGEGSLHPQSTGNRDVHGLFQQTSERGRELSADT